MSKAKDSKKTRSKVYKLIVSYDGVVDDVLDSTIERIVGKKTKDKGYVYEQSIRSLVFRFRSRRSVEEATAAAAGIVGTTAEIIER